ncbi:MAG: hypothetical protein ACREUN_08270, partial [Burkholderiales bacterium]
AQEDREKAAMLAGAQEIERKQRDLARRRVALEGQIAALRAEFESTEEESKLVAKQDQAREGQLSAGRAAAGVRRGMDATIKGKRR